MNKRVLVALTLMLFSLSWSQQLAFPEAMGFGAYSKGGREGKVLYVTNLNDQGAGSLRWAIDQRGARTVVFDVSGTIDLKSPLVIKYPNITIAGQTAPGDGICLKGATLEIAASDVVVRYLRVRLGDDATEADKGAIAITKGENIIIDHCSASWSSSGLLSAFSSKPNLNNITVQWCFITEGLSEEDQGVASLIEGAGGAKFSFLNNLYANNRGVNLKIGNSDENTYEKDSKGLLLDFRNNVIYNWGGEYTGYNANKESVTHLNYVNNYLIPKNNSKVTGKAYATGSRYNKSYFAGNYYNGKIPYNQWGIVKFNEDWNMEQVEAYKQEQAFKAEPEKTEDAIIAYSRVLAKAGATLPKRDAVDLRIVKGIKIQMGTVIKSQDDVGGWPELKSQPAPKDTDLDGIPDAWELENELNPENKQDRNDIADQGYTMLEEYLNSL